jgi:hypothetical protein
MSSTPGFLAHCRLRIGARGLKETDHGRHDSTRRVLLRAGAQQGGRGRPLSDGAPRGRLNLLAFSGFPEGRGSQLDFVPADPAAFKQFARTAKWKLTGPKRAILVSGEERVGAVAELHRKLAEAKINVTAIDAVCAGADRYGAILWVTPRDVSKAAKLLGAA